MIWILGASGYIGEAFVAEAKKRKLDYRSLSRRNLDYTDFQTLLGALKKEKPDFVVNAAGSTGKLNVEAYENQKGERVERNVTMAKTVASAALPCHPCYLGRPYLLSQVNSLIVSFLKLLTQKVIAGSPKNKLWN